MPQIALPLDWPVADRDEDFLISDSNRGAFDHLKRWSLWPVMATLVTGPRKSGRSLLGRLFGTLPVHDGSGELADKKMLSLLIIDVQSGGAAPLVVSGWPLLACCIRGIK